jgi:hypothetical protein
VEPPAAQVETHAGKISRIGVEGFEASDPRDGRGPDQGVDERRQEKWKEDASRHADSISAATARRLDAMRGPYQVID